MIQRFGSALNVNVPVHSLRLDGVSTPPAPPVFHARPAPMDEALATQHGSLTQSYVHFVSYWALVDRMTPSAPVTPSNIRKTNSH